MVGPSEPAFREPHLPTAYDGCDCECHRWDGIAHCIPCCYPPDPAEAPDE